MWQADRITSWTDQAPRQSEDAITQINEIDTPAAPSIMPKQERKDDELSEDMADIEDTTDIMEQRKTL